MFYRCIIIGDNRGDLGDKLLVNFGAIFNFTCEVTKLKWQRSVCVSAKIEAKFQNVINKDARALKDDLENLNT